MFKTKSALTRTTSTPSILPSKPQFALLLLLPLLCCLPTRQNAITEPKDINKTDTTTAGDTASSGSHFVPHRFSSSNNITILHEVHGLHSATERPLVLNTHEVLPVKPLKKKPYTLLDKTIFPDYEKPRPLKEYELHPVTFDFNLSDLEDLEHETVKKGDLSAEEKHLLRNADEAGLSYSERVLPFEDIESGVALAGVPATEVTLSVYTTEVTSLPTTNSTPVSTTTTTTIAPIITTPNVVATISPHIFKVHKNKTLKKGRELLKQEDEMPKNAGNNFNSISHYFGADPVVGEVNATAASLQTANTFQIITNLYDHFYWQASEIRTKVSTACGLEMQAYLTGLHGNFNWAQRAYDASGRYRGQLFFGNDKWLGQKNFCYELNRQLNPDERKHFEFEFYAALVALRLWMPQALNVNLQLGECLPRSCSAHDVQAILTLDPHAQMLVTLNTAAVMHAQHNQSIGHNDNNNSNNTNSSNNHTIIQVLHVRPVPGLFSYWRELKFQIFLSFMLTLLLLVITATWYQSKLNQLQLTTPHIPAISAKIDAVIAARAAGGIVTLDAGAAGTYTSNVSNSGSVKSRRGHQTPAFEVYQMSTLNENNNVLDIEADVNGNKMANNGTTAGHANGHSNGSAAAAASTNGAGGSGSSNGGSVRRPNGELSASEVGKSHLVDYRLETSSSVGASSTYEAKKQLSLHEQLLLCFAFQTNAGTILNMTENKEQQTSCVHGLRVFSVLWTIMVHTYLQMFTIGENRFQRNIVERSIWYQFVGNATFSVDTFFFISGFLLTLIFLKQEKKYPDDTGQFLRRSMKETGFVLLYRYIRLTPAYLFVILFNDFALRQTFNNSVFQPNVAADTCSSYWWRNILYINNFYPLSEICMIWSWYMANDMQFFVMASLLLVLSTRYFKSTAIIVCAFLLSSWGISGIISLHYRYTHKVANPFESFDFLYDKPWQRVGTYIMGMLAGLIIYKVKKPPPLSNRTHYLLWLGSWSLLAIIIFGVWNGELGRLMTAFYVSIGHTAFGVGLIWIVLSCCWGIAPTANRILSYRGLWPLSRLTYCTYLIHPVIMLITSFRMSGVVHLNNLFVMTIFLGNAVASFGVAFFISVLFEAPVIRILKIFYRK
ncbi:uncharacterized protein LOC126760599 [Bactrocera neohumeralis]|uniref:uncharacterized protein LOC126760599 n=1 Tax=Bactrocera neohumeralis TaxID=98809 RepID=UPI00216504F5|nr:uncharacterized protein LOC126760599 [Bactrocera neohumeralis]